jgi:rubrerythrin
MAFSDFQQSPTPLSHRICENFELPEDICRNCGYIVEAEDAPKICPACLHAQAFFEPMKQNY